MSTFLVICAVIIVFTLPARVAVRAQRRALVRELARRRTIVVPVPVYGTAVHRSIEQFERRRPVDDGRLYWGPSGSNGVAS